MQAVKELNAEVISTLSKETKADQLLEVSFRTGKLLKRIIMRRLQLEQEAHNIRKMSEKIAHREDKMVDTDAPNDGIDEVINKLKTMVQALDSGDDKTQVCNDLVSFFPFFFFCCDLRWIDSRARFFKNRLTLVPD